MAAPFVYDQAAFEAFCADLVRAGFSPVPGTDQGEWVGPVPSSFAEITDAGIMRIVIMDGWPAVAAKPFVPGLVADHVTPIHGYVCLWADDDPGQAVGQTWAALAARLDEWAAGAGAGFRPEDRALDAWAMFPGQAKLVAELDLPAILGTPHNGSIRALHGNPDAALRFARQPGADYPLEGVAFYRDRVPRTPRSLDEFRASLTENQRRNLDHGLSRRAAVAQNEASGGYDFAILVWPKYGQLDALVLSFSGAGDSLEAKPNVVSPSDIESRLRRAGPDAAALRNKRVLIAGAGAVGGQVALTLASSGIRELHLHDSDDLKTTNLVRHVLSEYMVGYSKTSGLKLRIEGAAPWCDVKAFDRTPLNPEEVEPLVRGFDLVVDCTGTYSASLAIADACEKASVPLVSVTLYRGGKVFRIQRQAEGETPILMREAPEFPSIPAGEEPVERGFLELGCTSPVHNAPPAVVTRAAADTALTCIDLLAGRSGHSQDAVTVLQPLDQALFNRAGTYAFPHRTDVRSTGE